MRRVNVLSKQQGMTWPVYDAQLKRGLAKRGLSRRKGLETSVTIPAEFHAWVLSCSKEQVAAIKASGTHVMGDLEDLTPTLHSPGPQPEDVPPEALLDSAIAGLVFATGDHAAEVARLRRRIDKVEGRPHPEQGSSGFKRALVGLSERRRSVMVARRGFRGIRDAWRRARD